MRQTSFGKTDLTVSVLGLGCSCLGGNLQKGDRQQATKTLQAALDAGINFYDTADSYGQGQSERLLGQTFKAQRDRVIFATKAGYQLSSAGSILAKAKPLLKPLVRLLKARQGGSLDKARGSMLRQDFSKPYLVKSVEGSLRRLQTDYLDVFQLHSPPTEVLRQGDVFETLANLKQQGKIRYCGVSCETLADAHLCFNYSGLSVLQVEINLLSQAGIQDLLSIAQEQGIAIVARQPFASGRLFRGSDEPVEQTVLEHYQRLAQQWDCSLAHLALQFVAQIEGVSVVIAGANTPAHLADNVHALQSKSLTPEQMTQLTQTQPAPLS